MSSPLLDEELRQILVLRWQLCEADLPAGEDLPYSAAWTRAQLLYQVLTEFFTETEAGRVAGLQAPGEVEDRTALRCPARAHGAAMPPNGSAASTLSTPHSSAAIDSSGGVPHR